jgi:hypothetical protein
MAVLIGVLAPTYLKYVESSKRTSDCTSIGSILDACEVLAIDPNTTWDGTEEITVSSTGAVSGAGTELDAITSCNGTKLQANWGGFTITATKGTDGKVTFTTTETEFATYNATLAGRFSAAAGE